MTRLELTEVPVGDVEVGRIVIHGGRRYVMTLVLDGRRTIYPERNGMIDLTDAHNHVVLGRDERVQVYADV